MSFVITVGHAQADGRRYVEEVHSDAQGEFSRLIYLADAGADHDAIASARNAVLLLQAAEQELDAAVAEDAMPVFRFQNAAEFVARFRARFLNERGENACRFARWLARRLVAGEVTVAQVRAAFNLTQTQFNQFRTRIEALQASLDAVENAVGE